MYTNKALLFENWNEEAMKNNKNENLVILMQTGSSIAVNPQFCHPTEREARGIQSNKIDNEFGFLLYYL